MKITLAKSAGFCSGVKRAINIALEVTRIEKSVKMLGDIVHNEYVAKQMHSAGIKKIIQLRKSGSGTLIIRAHGAPIQTFKKAHNLGYKVIDATCPTIQKIHTIVVSMEKIGHKIIIIGDNKHDEVQGIIGQLKHKAIIITPDKYFPLKKIKNINKATVVTQSTQDIEKVLPCIDKLKRYIPKVRFFNTICNSIQQKQKEIRILAIKHEIIIVIGSKKSANTKRLYKISQSLNSRTFWIKSKLDIKPIWFKGVRSVGIAAGASTPINIIQEIIQYIKMFTDDATKSS